MLLWSSNLLTIFYGLVIFLCCLHMMQCSGATRGQRRPEVRLPEGYKSPLDQGFPDDDYYYSSGEKLSPLDFPDQAGSGIANELPLCQRECLAKFSEAAKAAFQSNNNYERYMGVCKHYNETLMCMDKLGGEHCSNQDTFHVATSGIRYLCIEQRKAFDAVIECVDAQASEVEKECEHVCHVKERLAHWAVQSGVLDNFMEGALSSLANGESFTSQIFGRDTQLTAFGLQPKTEITAAALEGAKRAAAAATADTIKQVVKAASAKQDGGNGEQILSNLNLNAAPKIAPPSSKRITPDFMRAVVQDGCELVRCQLICVRVKFDAKCGGSAGTLLSEAFVRPISQAQEFLTYGSIAPFMGAFLPHQCDFMVKKEVLNEFRISPELDEALHQKFDVGEDGLQEKGQDGGVEQQHQQEQEDEGVTINDSVEQPPTMTVTAVSDQPNVISEIGQDAAHETNIKSIDEANALVAQKLVASENNRIEKNDREGKQHSNGIDNDGVGPGDISQVSTVGRTSPRKGPREQIIF